MNTTIATGTPTGMALATSDNYDFSGGGDGTRVNIIAPVSYVKDRNTLQWIDPNLVARPNRGASSARPARPFFATPAFTTGT